MPWELEIHTIDIGVGEASLIIAEDPAVPGSRRSILIDGGLSAAFGPLLTDLQPSAAGPAIVLPRPPQVDGTWSWSERDGVGITTFDIAPADGVARFPGTPPTVRSGWLRLHGSVRPPQ
ncbi:hypothetical protein [Micromonospora humida]|uniref:hypothetical protein n=1 Tax=Micromonospora humida TaxID=2809018 RepID=UPI00343F5806